MTTKADSYTAKDHWEGQINGLCDYINNVLYKKTGIKVKPNQLELVLEYDDHEDPCSRGSDHHKYQKMEVEAKGYTYLLSHHHSCPSQDSPTNNSLHLNLCGHRR